MTILDTQDSFKYIGFNYKEYLDKNCVNDSYFLSNFDNYQFSSNHLLILFSSIIIIGTGATLVVNDNLTIGSLIGFNIFSSRALVFSSRCPKIVFKFIWFKYANFLSV